MSSEASAQSQRTIETDVPARLDRLPWSRVRFRDRGPGRFREALRAAIAAGRVEPLPRGQFAQVETSGEDS